MCGAFSQQLQNPSAHTCVLNTASYRMTRVGSIVAQTWSRVVASQFNLRIAEVQYPVKTKLKLLITGEIRSHTGITSLLSLQEQLTIQASQPSCTNAIIRLYTKNNLEEVCLADTWELGSLVLSSDGSQTRMHFTFKSHSEVDVMHTLVWTYSITTAFLLHSTIGICLNSRP